MSKMNNQDAKLKQNIEKTSIEYAEKILDECSKTVYVHSRGSFIKGYLKAVEETNVKELGEALEWIVNTNSGISVNGYEKAINALNKTKA